MLKPDAWRRHSGLGQAFGASLMSVRPVNIMRREYVMIREYKVLGIIFGVEQDLV